MSLHFSEAEMARRGTLMADAVRASGLDAMLCFKQESMYWLTGYDTFGFSLFQCMIVTANGEVTLFTRRPDLLQAKHTSNIVNIHLWVDREGVNPGEELCALLASMKLKGARLGVEFESYGLTAANWRQLEIPLSGLCVFEDQSRLVDELRVVKSDEELECVRRAAKLSDDAWLAAIEHSGPGAFEGDILAEMQGAVFRGGGDYAGNEFIIGSGAGAMLVRYFSGRRHMTEGDQLTLEFSGAYARYHAAMMKTIVTTPVADRHRQMFDVVNDALGACHEALKPDAQMGDVFAEYARVCDAAGMKDYRFNACGYGMGAVFNPLWVDPPMFYADNALVMKAGSVFFLHMIIMDQSAGLAMTLGESFVVTDKGNERLSQVPIELIEKSA